MHGDAGRMRPLVFATESFMPLCSSSADNSIRILFEKLGIASLVVLMHLMVVLAWLMQPVPPRILLSEMSVSVAMQQAPLADIPPVPVSPPSTPRPRSLKPDSVVQKVLEEAKPEILSSLPVDLPPIPVTSTKETAPVIDTEPDYKAAYLNNPRPPYPMAARRMGWSGKVILDVEVTAAGACGAVRVFSSSGYAMLDDAALSSVKTWRFVPAKRAGQAVAQWVKVPINFSIRDNEV